MAKGVAFTDQAKADLRSIPQPIALQILRTLSRFLESQEGNVKRLAGVDPPLYRLRTQAHRIFFVTSATGLKLLACAITKKLTAKAGSQKVLCRAPVEPRNCQR